jgi:hypothetical protein
MMLLLAPHAPPVDFLLVKDGRPRCVIVVGPQASPSMRHGAEELRDHIQKMSGARLSIVTALPKGSKAITLKSSPTMGAEEYRVKSTPTGIEIVGGRQRGVMYGCYALLEDDLGVRWYTARHTKVPKRATVTLNKLDVMGKPAFEYREPFYTEAFDKDWAARNRVNGNSQRLDASVGGKVSYGPFVHTFNELVPPETYFDTHPEYFSMIDGQRKKGYYQLCLTNPDVAQIAIAKVEEWIKQYPDATIFSVSQNDTYSNCQCSACLAVEKEEGAPSGPLIRFVNTVAQAIGRKHPNVLIDTLAYQWSEKPPLKVRPLSNVRIRIAPIGACFSHPLDKCTENALPYQNLLNWAKVTRNIYIWHYTTNFSGYLQPLPNLDEIAGDTVLFRKNGVVGFFDEGGYAPGGGSELADLKSYLLAKLMWDPTRKAQPIIDDFLAGVYGKAAPFVGKWIDLIHASGRAMQSHARIYDPPTAPYLTDETLRQGENLLTQAEQVVANDSAELEGVQRIRLGLDYVKLLRLPNTDPRYSVLAHAVADRIRKFGIGEIREGEPVDAFLKRIGQG